MGQMHGVRVLDQSTTVFGAMADRAAYDYIAL